MQFLELLAPAKNLTVGIAAIDCGADAVYIAGPSFGARKDAGNSVGDIAQLCTYAHRFGARIFAAVNTLVYEEELEQVRELALALQDAGVDALIVQDMALAAFARQSGLSGGATLRIPLHASTQCAIRDAGTALRLAEAGFSRLILERQLSLKEIRRIREATAGTGVELECFVHGALCVCYSGQCYLSEALCGRSANRGACVQACRSRYTLYDEIGRILLKDKAVLSLKDLNLLARIEELAGTGVTSFKIEGRLKNESYVRNVVTAYSQALDAFIAAHPLAYQRASFGRVETKFVPQLDKTFNRGYTQLYLDGKKGGGWASMDAPKGMGEYIGTLRSFGRNFVEIEGVATARDGESSAGLRFMPGDGLSFVARDGAVEGFRVDTVQSPLAAGSARVGCQPPASLYRGAHIFRNLDVAFEKQLSSQPSKRVIPVDIQLGVQSPKDGLYASPGGRQWRMTATAVSEDGRTAALEEFVSAPVASNLARMHSLLRDQLSKSVGHYQCRYVPLAVQDALPLLPASVLNDIRRRLCEKLDAEPCRLHPLHQAQTIRPMRAGENTSYKNNLSNSVAADFCGADAAEAYELHHQPEAELMRTRYCVRNELGLCPRRQRQTASDRSTRESAVQAGPLFLENNGRRFRLDFDCPRCEMTLKAAH